jgi:hypothetical protein
MPERMVAPAGPGPLGRAQGWAAFALPGVRDATSGPRAQGSPPTAESGGGRLPGLPVLLRTGAGRSWNQA